MPFAFYDLETTGRSSAYDHPLQFAAILTDDHFQQVERVNLRCRLAPHILPSPGALAVTGVSPKQLIDPSLPNWMEMMRAIQQLAEKWAPATWTGYNSISFDENFLRQSFYQTLQPEIYATQFHGNTRLDIMRLVYAAYVKAPHCLNWPKDDTGKIIFKLDKLAPANGFDDHHAHDALGDVEATIHLLKLIGDRAPRLYQDVLSNRDKAHVIDLLKSGEPLEFVTRAGAGPPRAFMGCGCGFDAQSSNAAGFFDVEMEDPQTYFETEEGGLKALLDRSPRVIRRLKVNETPMLFRATDADERAQRRCQQIAENAGFRRRIGLAMARVTEEKYPPPEPGADVRIEDRIFEGFYSSADKQLLGRFHQTDDWNARLSVVEQFEDSRLRHLGVRAAVLFGGDQMPSEMAAAASRNILAKWRADDAPRNSWTTLNSAETELKQLLEDGKVNQEKAAELRAFYLDRVRRLEGGGRL